MLHYDFLLRTVQSFLQVKEWIQLQTTNKTIAQLCSALPLDDWLILCKFLEVFVWPNTLFSVFHLTFSLSKDYCTMGFIKWNDTSDMSRDYYINVGPQYFPKSLVQSVDCLILESYFHGIREFPCEITDFSSRFCSVVIGNKIIPCFTQTLNMIDGNITQVTISKQTMRDYVMDVGNCTQMNMSEISKKMEQKRMTRINYANLPPVFGMQQRSDMEKFLYPDEALAHYKEMAHLHNGVTIQFKSDSFDRVINKYHLINGKHLRDISVHSRNWWEFQMEGVYDRDRLTKIAQELGKEPEVNVADPSIWTRLTTDV